MIIYVVTFDNDGDFPDKEIGLVTIHKYLAMQKIYDRPKTYALSMIQEWEDNKLLTTTIYNDDFKNPTIISWNK